MTDQKPKETSEDDTLQNELSERGREVWLAGLGALATVEEEGTKLFNRLIDRGQEFEAERRDEIENVTEKAREQRDEALSQIEEVGEETQSALTNTVNSALERFGVPTRNEVDRLTDRVEALSQRVEELTEALSDDQSSPADQQ